MLTWRIYTNDELVTGLNQSKVIIVQGVKFMAWEIHFLFFDASRQAVGHKGPFFLRYNSQDMKLTAHPHLVLRLSVSRAVPPQLCILSHCAQRKPGWSHSMNYTPHFNEDRQILQKLFRACTHGWPDTQLSRHHKHIIIISNSSSRV